MIMKNAVIAMTAIMLGAVGHEADAAVTATAQSALARAQEDVKRAESYHNMWTVTEPTLKKAEEAAQKGNSEDVVKYARLASEYAKQSIEQVRYPLVH